MTNKDKDYVVTVFALSRMSFLRLHEKLILLKKLDSIDDLAVLSIEDISSICGRSFSAFYNPKVIIKDAHRDLYLLNKLGIHFVLYTDSKFPLLLKEISDPPFLLFYRGNIDILENYCISVVGTRKIVASAAKCTFEFSKDACLDGATIVSGLAYGVDKKAHEGAIDAFFENNCCLGKTVAVLPAGIDNIIPNGHKRLASKIIDSGGCLISEYPPGFEAMPYRFVQRNRIIAGLSCVTVIMQAPPASGAMLTAQFALDYNREVMIHEVAFSQESMRISTFVKSQLERKALVDKKYQSKLLNSPEKYVQDGAKIIKNYADFCQKLDDSFIKIQYKQDATQLELFE